MKSKLVKITLIATLASLMSCAREADVVDANFTEAGKSFEVPRRAVFYNGITGEYILSIEGLLTPKVENDRLELFVKTGPKEYKKHILGLSDNVTYFIEQIDPINVDPFHYRVIFRPKTIVPDIEVQK